MNVELLQRVKASILEEPRRVNMCFFLDRADSVGLLKPTCNTVGCIAGWAAAITWMDRNQGLSLANDEIDPIVDVFRSVDASARVLDLSHRQATELFYPDPSWGYGDGWPEDLLFRLRKLRPQRPAYARVVAEGIDRFIACGGDWSNEEAPNG